MPGGTYSTSDFHPTITYTVPTGWSNFLDVAGLFLLMPPGASAPGNTITTDFIGVQTQVAAQASDCSTNPAAGVGRTPDALVGWMTAQSGLSVTNRHTVNIGGLHGIAVDVRETKGWTKGCSIPGLPGPDVPLAVGVAPSQFDHEMVPGYAERDYLFGYSGGTLMVNLVDTSGGTHLDAYSRVAATFRFGS